MAMTNDQKTIKKIAGKLKRITEGDVLKIENVETRSWFQHIFQDVHNFVSSAALGTAHLEKTVDNLTEVTETGDENEK